MKNAAKRIAEKLKKLEKIDIAQMMYIEGRIDVLLEQKDKNLKKAM